MLFTIYVKDLVMIHLHESFFCTTGNGFGHYWRQQRSPGYIGLQETPQRFEFFLRHVFGLALREMILHSGLMQYPGWVAICHKLLMVWLPRPSASRNLDQSAILPA
jgi:hypothetical protein